MKAADSQSIWKNIWDRVQLPTVRLQPLTSPKQCDGTKLYCIRGERDIQKTKIPC